MASPHGYYSEVNGKAYDIDGWYGAQCWDGFAHFTRKYFKKLYNCSATGYVIDLWTLRKTNGSSKNFTFVESRGSLKDGDWVIFKRGGATPSSHVGMFRKWANKEKTKMVLLGQNQGGAGGRFNQVVVSVSTFAGALRPRMYHVAAPVAVKRYHTVKSGDTMSGIAVKYKMTLAKLAKLNPGIKNLNQINVGQKVRVR